MKRLLVLALVLWSAPAWACTDLTVTAGLTDTGNPVTNGNNLQTKLSAAVGGDVLVLQKGIEYRRNFAVGQHTGAAITVRTSSCNLASDTRVSPASLSEMPLLTTPNGSPVLIFNADANDWTFVGLAFTTAGQYPSGQVTPFLIANNNDGSITYNHWPKRIAFDRLLVYARETDPLPYRSAEEGIVVDGETITITNSYIYNFMGWEYPTFTSPISTVSNANPAVITFSSPQAFPTNPTLMFFAGGTGGWAGLNGLKLVTQAGDASHGSVQNFDTNLTITNLNSTGFGSYSGQTVTKGSNVIATSRGITIQVGPGPYTITNNYVEAYYTALFGGGASNTWLPPGNDVTITAVNSISQIVLTGVGTLQVGDMIAIGSFEDQTVTTAFPYAPDTGWTQLTTSTTNRFPVGTPLFGEGCITVSGFTGAWAPLNGCRVAYVVDAHNVIVNVNSTGFGAVTGSGTKWVANVKSGLQFMVGKVTNISGGTVDYNWWGHQPDNTNGNGAGLKAVNGARVIFNGRNVDGGLTITTNTFANQRYWVKVLRDLVGLCNNCTGQPPHGNWEVKTAENVTVRGNTFTMVGGSLFPSDDEQALGLNQANQLGATPWVRIFNWLIESNLFLNYFPIAQSTVEEYESGSVGGSITFRNNLASFTMSEATVITGGTNAVFQHNTIRNNFNAGLSGGGNHFVRILQGPTGTVIRDNVASGLIDAYQVGDGAGWPSPTRDHNYLIDTGNVGFTVPAGDVRIPGTGPAGLDGMGFVNVAAADGTNGVGAGDYHGYALSPSSPGHHAASDGTDVGVNFTTLDAALAGTGPAPPPVGTSSSTLRGGATTNLRGTGSLR